MSGRTCSLGPAHPRQSPGSSGKRGNHARQRRARTGTAHRAAARRVMLSSCFPFLGAGSDGTLVDVAPSPRRIQRKTGSDRMVGLLVVRPGVLVRRVIRTGHPAAGQADHKVRPAARGARTVPAVPAAARPGPHPRKPVKMLTPRGHPVRAHGRRAQARALTRNHGDLPQRDGNTRPGRPVSHESTPRSTRRKQATTARPITRTDHRGTRPRMFLTRGK
jgi:hypothetical protein